MKLDERGGGKTRKEWSIFIFISAMLAMTFFIVSNIFILAKLTVGTW